MATPPVHFDVLLRPTREHVTLETVKESRPSEEAIAKCKRWLEGRGVVCHETAFGLACSTPREVFERLFQTSLVANPEKPGTAAFRLEKPVRVPEDLSDIVERVTLPVTPEFF